VLCYDIDIELKECAADRSFQLERIAMLNGIPVEARSWRHSSIANRMRLLDKYARDPGATRRLELSVIAIKIFLIIGTIAGLTIGLWLYWPK